jgi:hypothetical protein
MSFLAPWLLVAGATAALGIVALHLLTTRRPPPAPLPTARFVPESEVRAVARAQRPTDLLLLALRALAVLAIGAAFARPVLDAPGPTVRTIVALEWTRALADTAEALRLARSEIAEGGAVLVFDTTAHEVAATDSLRGLTAPSVAQASLSSVFPAALAAAERIARGADSVRLVLVTALSSGALDAASHALRDAWPGRIEVRQVRGDADTARGPRVTLRSALADDPLAPALERARASRGSHEVRAVRGAFTAADSQWLAASAGRLVLVWPSLADSLVPDAVSAFDGSATATLVAPLQRAPVPNGDRVVARWRDGAPAAVERAVAQGCVREIGIRLPMAGDLTLRESFASVLDRLLAPCGGARSVAMDSASAAFLTRAGALAPATALVQRSTGNQALPLLLLAFAALLLAAEQVLRRRAAAETGVAAAAGALT